MVFLKDLILISLQYSGIRQITNSNTTQDKGKDCLRVIKSRNISVDGKEIIDIPGYDSYIKKDTVEKFECL